MPAGALYTLLPAFTPSLRRLHMHLRAPGLLSRDFVGLGRLTALTALHIDVEVTGEVLIMGLRELQPLAGLRELSIDAVTKPTVPGEYHMNPLSCLLTFNGEVLIYGAAAAGGPARTEH